MNHKTADGRRRNIDVIKTGVQLTEPLSREKNQQILQLESIFLQLIKKKNVISVLLLQKYLTAIKQYYIITQGSLLNQIMTYFLEVLSHRRKDRAVNTTGNKFFLFFVKEFRQCMCEPRENAEENRMKNCSKVCSIRR